MATCVYLAEAESSLLSFNIRSCVIVFTYLTQLRSLALRWSLTHFNLVPPVGVIQPAKFRLSSSCYRSLVQFQMAYRPVSSEFTIISDCLLMLINLVDQRLHHTRATHCVCPRTSPLWSHPFGHDSSSTDRHFNGVYRTIERWYPGQPTVVRDSRYGVIVGYYIPRLINPKHIAWCDHSNGLLIATTA